MMLIAAAAAVALAGSKGKKKEKEAAEHRKQELAESYSKLSSRYRNSGGDMEKDIASLRARLKEKDSR